MNHSHSHLPGNEMPLPELIFRKSIDFLGDLTDIFLDPGPRLLDNSGIILGVDANILILHGRISPETGCHTKQSSLTRLHILVKIVEILL